MTTPNSKNPAPTLSNVAAERAVLAGICRYGTDSYVEVSSLLNENTFTVDHNKVLYKCLTHLLGKSNTVDFASILSSAGAIGLNEYINKPEVLKHVRGILETPINLDNVYDNAAIIRRLQYGREIQEKLRECFRNVNGITGSETLSQIQSLVESPIQELTLSYIHEDSNIPKLLGAKVLDYLQHLKENPCEIVGLSSGFPAYDKAIGGGFRRKCVDVVGARAKAGKSVFCDNVAIHNMRKGIPVLVLDTEMSEEDHWNRIVANIANVPINTISTGKFGENPEEDKRVFLAGKELASLPYYYINISGQPFEDTLAIIKRWLLKVVGYDDNGRMNDCLVIYDYLKLMSSNDMNDLKEYQVLGFNITQLHNLTVEYDFPCLTFCQLNRDGITNESTASVSGSDRIVWLCTSFSILKSKTEDEIATDGIRAGNRKLVPIVSRHGPGLDAGYVCLQMDGEYARLRHLGSVSDITKERTFPSRSSNTEDEDGEQMEGTFS